MHGAPFLEVKRRRARHYLAHKRGHIHEVSTRECIVAAASRGGLDKRCAQKEARATRWGSRGSDRTLSPQSAPPSPFTRVMLDAYAYCLLEHRVLFGFAPMGWQTIAVSPKSGTIGG